MENNADFAGDGKEAWIWKKFILLYFDFDLSHKGTPTKCIISQINAVFILLSNGDEEFKEGQTLTSRTQGFKS